MDYKMKKSISIQNLQFKYKNGQLIFNDFNFDFVQDAGRGKITAIMGASGSGKTTLMKLLLGIEKPQKGQLEILPKQSVISYVPQEAVLFEHLSVTDNACYFKFAGAHKQRFNQLLYQDLVQSLGLEEVLASAKSVNEISGGQKQRLSLLRALSIEPDFLLLDEPCNGLDAAVKRSFLNKLREITEKYGLFVLYITHHKLEAQLIADDVVYLIQGKENNTLQNAVHAPIDKFLNMPPVLEAVQVFRFPDAKLLPIYQDASGKALIAMKGNDITNYWLVDNENIVINSADGWPFKLVSKSPIYGVIRHEDSRTEWMLPTYLLSDHEVNDTISISIKGGINKYDQDGILISK